MENFLIIEIPAFRPKYKRWIKYGWKNSKEKQNLQKVLLDAGRGYCMYCYRRILVDNRFFGQIEHAIEKGNSELLYECIPNMGIACSVCNQSLKRYGEKSRKITNEQKRDFMEHSSCGNGKRKQCTVPCKSLRNLSMAYTQSSEAHIILQPMGIFSKKTGTPFQIQYNILKSEFEPAVSVYHYCKEDIDYIEEHIDRFQLNEPSLKSNQLFQFIKMVIDNEGILPEYEYNNLTVELFAEKLQKKSKHEVLKICEALYCACYLSCTC